MKQLRLLRLLSPRHNNGRIFTRNVSETDSSKTAQPQAKIKYEEDVEQEMDLHKEKIEKKRQNPIIENFFLHSLEKDMFEYPEVLPRNHYLDMARRDEKIAKFMKSNEVNSHEIDRTRIIPPSVQSALSDLSLYASHIPEEYGGLDCNLTASLKLHESVAHDSSIHNHLLHQNITVIRLLTKYGSDGQKEKYLARLARGEIKATLCLYDNPEGVSELDEKTTTQRNVHDFHEFVVSGKKVLIPADPVDLYVVLARNSVADGATESVYSTFSLVIVDCMGACGLKKSYKDHTLRLGSKAVKLCDLTFDAVDTYGDALSLLGKYGQGGQQIRHVMQEARLFPAVSCLAIVKELLHFLTRKLKTSEEFGRTVASFGLFQQSLVALAADIFAMESMIYFTSGVIDSWDQAEAHMESIACQIFCTECTMKHLLEFMPLILTSGTEDEKAKFERFLGDRLDAPLFEGRLDVLLTEISTLAFKAIKQEVANNVAFECSPLHHPVTLYRWSRHMILNFRDRMVQGPFQLRSWFHPTLGPCVDFLEKGIEDLKAMAVPHCYSLVNPLEEILLHGRLCNLGSISAKLYALSCVLSRTNRTYLLAHPHSQLERALCIAFTRMHGEKIAADLRYVERDIEEKYLALHGFIYYSLSDLNGYEITHPTFKFLL